ncbi:MAG: sulfate adenylyltransferase subunit CysD [Pseudomonadota bacterium]
MGQIDLAGLDAPQAWSTELAFLQLHERGLADSKRTAERWLHRQNLLPTELNAELLIDDRDASPIPAVLRHAFESCRAQRRLILFAQLSLMPGNIHCLHANDARGARYWRPMHEALTVDALTAALVDLQRLTGKDLAIFPHGHLVTLCRQLAPLHKVTIELLAFPESLDMFSTLAKPRGPMAPHLSGMEAESIHILRQGVASAHRPALLYSGGKDSSVLLHLMRKAFYPCLPPLPLLHIDTRWAFQQIATFRDRVARDSGLELLVHTNPEALAKDINPFDHGASLYTDMSATEGLKQAMARFGYDVVFGGARRDEAAVRSKEHIFSLRSTNQSWNPSQQRVEPWKLYNTRKRLGESLRVFPLSNWTELDIWQYIYQEGIVVLPLYFARERPVVRREGRLIMVDDRRMNLRPDERIEKKRVRFRSIGCYPLTGAIESGATDPAGIILELLTSRSSERQGRQIDDVGNASLEKKKQEGYF